MTQNLTPVIQYIMSQNLTPPPSTEEGEVLLADISLQPSLNFTSERHFLEEVRFVTNFAPIIYRLSYIISKSFKSI